MNLARVCERYGGGGHARVGGDLVRRHQARRVARRAAFEIAEELRASVRGMWTRDEIVRLYELGARRFHAVAKLSANVT